jgi:hypothetical protein
MAQEQNEEQGASKEQFEQKITEVHRIDSLLLMLILISNDTYSMIVIFKSLQRH